MKVQNEKLERSIISRMVTNVKSAILSIEILNESDFTNNLSKELFKGIKTALKQGVNIDLMLLDNLITKFGGESSDIVNYMNAEFFDINNACLKLKELTILRNLKLLSLNLTHKLTDNSMDALQVLDYVSTEVQAIQNSIEFEKERKNSDITDEYVKDLHERIENPIQAGSSTGLKELDYQTGEWKEGQNIVIAGRPGMGKTTLAITCAVFQAMEGKNVAFVSCEMTDVELMDSIISNISGISRKKMEDYADELTKQEIELIYKAKDIIDNLPLHIKGMSSPSVEDVGLYFSKLNLESKLYAGYVDYIQLMSAKGLQDTKAIEHNSRGFKALALKLKIRTIPLSQLNRAVENRDNKMPKLSDLRGAGAIEEDADKIMLCYRPDYYMSEEEIMHDVEGLAGKVIINVAKNRKGKCGNRELKHNFDLGRFENWVEDDFAPEAVQVMQPPQIDPTTLTKDLDNIPF